MNRFLDFFAFFSSRLARFCLWLAAGGLVVLTAVVAWQVWGRYVLNSTPDWAERTALLLVLYFSLIAAAAGVRNRGHLSIVFLQETLPDRMRFFLVALSHLLVAGFGVGMVWYGYQLAEATWNQTIPTVGLPAGFTYVPVPLAGVLITIFAVEHMLNDILGRDIDGMEE